MIEINRTIKNILEASLSTKNAIKVLQSKQIQILLLSGILPSNENTTGNK